MLKNEKGIRKGDTVVFLVDGDNDATDEYNRYNYPGRIRIGDRREVLRTDRDQVLCMFPDTIDHFGFEGSQWWVHNDAVAKVKRKVV